MLAYKAWGIVPVATRSLKSRPSLLSRTFSTSYTMNKERVCIIGSGNWYVMSFTLPFVSSIPKVSFPQSNAITAGEL